MNDHAVAYSLSFPQDMDHCGSLLPDNPGQCDDKNGSVITFTSSEECRASLRNAPAAVPVIVCNGFGTVTPINLAAALCMDALERDVYLMEDSPTESLASRCRSAGIRGILDHSQAMRLLDDNRTLWIRDADLSRSANQSLTLCQSEDTSHSSAMVSAPLSTLSPGEFQPVLESLPTTVPEMLGDYPCQDGYPLPIEHPSMNGHPLSDGFSPLIEPQQSTMVNQVGKGRIIGIFSGRGGVGKSTVALMSALLAQRNGSRVALVDLDLQFGDLDFLAGKEPSSRIQRLTLQEICGNVGAYSCPDDVMSLISPPKQPEQGESYASDIPELLYGLAAKRDLVVVNTGAFWTEIHARIAQCCHHLMFLMDQRATSIEACKQVVDLCVRMQTPQARFLYLLNGCGKRASLSPFDVSLALGGVEVNGIADGGSLVDELLALGCPMELLSSGNAFINSLDALLGSLLGQVSAISPQEPLVVQGHNKVKAFNLSSLRDLFGGMRRVTT